MLLNGYAAFSYWQDIFPNAGYNTDANEIKSFLDTVVWDSTEERFEGGRNDGRDPLDVNSWGILSLGSGGDSEPNYANALNYVENTHKNSFDFNESNITGYDFDGQYTSSGQTTPDDIWWEGTAHIALAQQALGNVTESEKIIDEIIKIQDINGGIPYSLNGTNNGYFNMKTDNSVAATSWLILAVNGVNPLQPDNLTNISYAIDVDTNLINEDATSNDITFTITRTGRKDQISTIDFSFLGDATNGSDYNNITNTNQTGISFGGNTITFAEGAEEAIITLDIVDDTDMEANEDIILNLSNPTANTGFNAILSSQNSSTVTIISNDIIISPGAEFDLLSLNGTNGFVINGIDVDDGTGRSLSSAGDINGDGIDDIIIGAPYADPNNKSGAGESYVVFGSNTGFGAILDLSNLDGTNGFIINGINSGDRSGRSLSSAGDFNKDGFDDIIIGAPYADPNGKSSAGESYVIFGSNTGFGASLDLSSLDGTNGFTVNGINSGDRSGSRVSSAGDVNGDDIDDIIIGAYWADINDKTRAGQSYVVFGSNSGFPASLDLSTLNGNNGFILNGIDADDQSGYSVSGVGDINNDGIDDFAIGAILASRGYVVFGNNSGFAASLELSSLNGSNGFVFVGEGSHLGVSVSDAGDVNGDGIKDLIIGADTANPNGVNDAGKSYVVFGTSNLGSSGNFDLSTLNGTGGFVIQGTNVGDISGYRVSSAGDVNNDGFDDLIVGAPGADPNSKSFAGKTYVVFGKAGFNATLDLSSINVTNGFIIPGLDSYDHLGRSVSGAGDINNDGFDDIIVGAPYADPNGNSSAGESYVIFGGNFNLPNNPPIINNQIADQQIIANQSFNFSFNSNTFTDADGDTLTYSATLANGNPLPTWLTFNSNTRTFSGTPNTAETISIKVTANDNNGGFISDEFQLQINNFEADDYIASNTDLIYAFSYNLDAATQHYFNYGQSEGRVTDNFDEQAYLNSYSDLQNAFGNHLDAATRHYIEYGFFEGRDPLSGFNGAAYIASYSDLIGAFGYNPDAGKEHYRNHGYQEGRNITFEADDYIASYPDLIQAFGYNLDAGTEHYISYGSSEGRSIDNFNEQAYLNAYSDLQNAFGNDLVTATRHYIQYGYFEGRTF